MNRRKKSGFLTFCFSLIPGAGEMYLGIYEDGCQLDGIVFCSNSGRRIFECGIGAAD